MGRLFGRRTDRNGQEESAAVDLTSKEPQKPKVNSPEHPSQWFRPTWDSTAPRDGKLVIIIPRTDIDITRLLLSLGAEIKVEVTKSGTNRSEHYQVMEIPDSLTVRRGGMAKEGEFHCQEGVVHDGVLPEAIYSPDGEVVVAFFDTNRGSTQLIGPTWTGIPDKFPTSAPVPDLPENVISVTVDSDFEIPQGRNWELLVMGVKKLGDYPVELKCLKDLAAKANVSSSSDEAQELFSSLMQRIEAHYSSIRLVRGTNLQAYLSQSAEISDPLSL